MADLSVVIPAVNAFSDLRNCLSALQAQDHVEIEIIVVERIGAHLRANIEREFTGVTVIPVVPDTTIPDMRAVAIRATSAPVVAVIEDHVIVPAGWAKAGLDAIADGHTVVGGPVTNAATDTLTDWAAFLCEYSAVLPPLPEGPSNWLPGNNVFYTRAVLDKFDAVLDEGRWENRLHDAIREAGHELYMTAAITAGHKMHYTFGLYMSQRFLYSRAYAGMRVAGQSLPKRLAMGAAACALPAIVYLRVVRNIWTKGAHRAELIKSLPMLVPFAASWGFGEAVGYVFGEGNALAKVR